MTRETGGFPTPKTRAQKAEETLAWARADNAALREQVETLKAQLAAATNDAARAELRAQEVVAILERRGLCCLKHDGKMRCKEHNERTLCENCATQEFIAAPDSDARLRDLIGDAIQYGGREVDDLDEAVDEVLGVKS